MPVQDVEVLVVVIPWDKTTVCYEYVKNDCLLLLDEVQDFWPATRDRLGKEITELITQHGQRGLDIILMGQSNKDCHALWRRRIDKLIYFVQKDAVGRPTEYAWQLFKQVAPDKFSKINGGGGKYEAKFFGVYSSHVAGTNNKTAYLDGRANIFKTPVFRFGIPAFALVVIGAVWYLVHFLTEPSVMVKTAQAAQLPVSRTAVNSVVVSRSGAEIEMAAANFPVGFERYIPPPDYVDVLIKDFRPRLAAYIQRGDKLFGKVDFFISDGQHRRDTLTFESIREFGWTVEVREFGILITKGDKSHAITSWPFDLAGQVPQVVRSSGYITGQAETIN